MEKLLGVLVFLVVLYVLVILTVIVFTVIEENSHCGLFEDKIVHQDSYTTFVWSGKIMVPITHPSGDYPQRVCTKPK